MRNWIYCWACPVARRINETNLIEKAYIYFWFNHEKWLATRSNGNPNITTIANGWLADLKVKTVMFEGVHLFFMHSYLSVLKIDQPKKGVFVSQVLHFQLNLNHQHGWRTLQREEKWYIYPKYAQLITYYWATQCDHFHPKYLYNML